MLRILGSKHSSNTQTVLWCCAELGLPYELSGRGGPFGGHKEPAYLALNPNGLVPTIVDGDFVLWESNAIVRYLAAEHGAGRLSPADAGDRAPAEMWMDWQQSTLRPAIRPLFVARARQADRQPDATAIEAARSRGEDALAILDEALADRDYVAGPRFTMGDIPAGILVYRWYTMDIPRQPHPNVEAWYLRLGERPAFRDHVMIGLA